MRRLALIAVVTAIAGCGRSDAPAAASAPPGTTTFARLQASVFTPSCAFSACHAANNSSGSGLTLVGDGVYEALVGAASTNANARADGLRRVVAGKPDSSLLWHKVNGYTAGHHARDYGAPMPFGGQPLPAGQVEFIRQWIAGGASRTGDGVTPDLLTGAATPVTYTPLSPPAAGYQVKLAPFTVPASSEREIFSYLPVGNTQVAYVNRIQTSMRAGSHHFVLYSFAEGTPSAILPAQGTVRDLRDASGTYQAATLATMAFHVFFAGTQTSTSDFTFPAGVAVKLPANALLDVNAHNVNATTVSSVGEGEANLYTVPASQVQFEATALNLNNTDLTLPAGRDTTIRKTFKFSKLTRVVMLTSHMHKRGTRFVIRIAGGARDGEIVYQSDAWDHPPIVSFPTPVTLNPGEGLTSEVTYRGDPGKVVRFGLTADDEMDIIFGYWY
jgi:hypothetical protein